jgi:hypothetical protein
MADQNQSIWDQMLENARQTAFIKAIQNGLQQYGYNRQQDIPIGQGGTGNSVLQALTVGKVGAQQMPTTPGGGAGGSGGGGAGGDDNWVDPAKRTTSGNGGGGNTGGQNNSNQNNGGIDFSGMLNEQRGLARSAYDEGMRRANSAFERARGLYDEGVGLIGKRRGEFKDMFDTGNQDITQEYQSRGGELGTSAQNRRLADAGALQAQGFGGSAVERAKNRQSVDETRALRSLMQSRDTNKRENQSQFNERQTWADTQESGLRRGLETADENRRAAEAQTGLIERGDQAGITNNINSFLQNILQNQQALNASNTGVGQYEANPYAVNIADVTGQLQAQLPTTTTGASGVQAANIDEQQKKLALLRKQAGGNMYGLRA